MKTSPRAAMREPILVRASRDKLMATTTLTIDPKEIVRPLDVHLAP